MRKGKFGVTLTVGAIISFILAYFGIWEAMLLVGAYVLLAEKDEWQIRQWLQALFLMVAKVVVDWALYRAFSVFIGRADTYNWTNALDTYKFANAMTTVRDILVSIVGVMFLVLVIIAVIKNAAGKDAGLPVFSSLADKAMGIVKAPPQYQQYQSQPQQTPVQQPVQNQTAPQYQQPQTQQVQNPQQPGADSTGTQQGQQ